MDLLFKIIDLKGLLVRDPDGEINIEKSIERINIELKRNNAISEITKETLMQLIERDKDFYSFWFYGEIPLSGIKTEDFLKEDDGIKLYCRNPKDRVYESVLALDMGFGVTFWQIMMRNLPLSETEIRTHLDELCREYAIEEFKNSLFRCL